jgi:hypothetical protein
MAYQAGGSQGDPLSFYQSSYAQPAFIGNPHQANTYAPQQAQQPIYCASGLAGEDVPTGWVAAFTAASYPGEQSLLEELGVNFGHIREKTLTVLNPLGRGGAIDKHMMDDSDLFGPLLFGILFGFILLLSGKVKFGYVYGCAIIGCLTLHSILSLMASASTTLSRTASVLGYCLLPLVVISLPGLVMSMDSLVGYSLTSIAILWSTYSASAIFVSVLQMDHMRMLVAYPVALFYSIFAILTLFAEKVEIRR